MSVQNLNNPLPAFHTILLPHLNWVLQQRIHREGTLFNFVVLFINYSFFTFTPDIPEGRDIL